MRRLVTVLVLATVAAACSGSEAAAPASTVGTSPSAPTTTSSSTTTTTVLPATTSTTSTTTTSSTTTSTTTSTSTSTSTTTTTTPPPPPPTPTRPQVPPIAPIDAFAFPFDTEIEIGRSVQDRPITVIRRGTPGGTRVLAVGVIHGNEAAGTAIIDRLAVDVVPDGVELWLVRSMNPDGQAISDRQNANLVDLNRNFPHNWDYLGSVGDWQYAGPGPASEPETQAMVALGESVRPDLIFWYHQDLFRINPGSGRNGEIRTRYAQIAGLPLVDITGGTYTGTAAQWARTVMNDLGAGITVELGESVTDEQITNHVAAVHTVAVEFFG